MGHVTHDSVVFPQVKFFLFLISVKSSCAGMLLTQGSSYGPEQFCSEGERGGKGEVRGAAEKGEREEIRGAGEREGKGEVNNNTDNGGLQSR